MNAAKRAPINRENARKSTGPTTPHGKQASAMNGFKHGLTGQRMILQEHEVEPYRRLSQSLHSELRPQSELESQLVQKIVDCNMRLNRAAAIDSNLMNIGLADNTREALHDDVTESVIAQTRSWVNQADSFEKLGRYEGRISRQLIQYMHELERIRNLRKSQLVAAEKPAEAAESKKDNHKLALFRKHRSPDFVPRVMTAVSVGSPPPTPPGGPVLVQKERAQPDTSGQGQIV